SMHVDTHKNPTVWEYETPAFEASSSLPNLSLLISEKPTQPELKSQGKVTRRLPGIDEITTVPPLQVDHSVTSSRALVSVNSQHAVPSFNRPDQTTAQHISSEEVDATSWTSGKAS